MPFFVRNQSGAHRTGLSSFGESGTAKGIGQAATDGTLGGSSSAGRGPTRWHENRVLAGLPEAELTSLARHFHVVSLPPGTALQQQPLPLDQVYFPHQGVVSLLAVTPNGETIEVASAGRGGAACPILPSDRRDGFLTAVAHGPLRASRIASARLQALLAENEALERAMDACREALVVQMQQNLVCAGLHSVEHRLARWLLETADRMETDTIATTQEHVAQRLGVRRTTVTLLASKLQDSGAINCARSRVDILDRRRLEAATCSCYTVLRAHTSKLLWHEPPPLGANPLIF